MVLLGTSLAIYLLGAASPDGSRAYSGTTAEILGATLLAAGPWSLALPRRDLGRRGGSARPSSPCSPRAAWPSRPTPSRHSPAAGPPCATAPPTTGRPPSAAPRVVVTSAPLADGPSLGHRSPELALDTTGLTPGGPDASAPSVSEVAGPREVHRHPGRLRRLDDLGVPHRPAGLATARTPASSSTSSPSANGKNASDAATAPGPAPPRPAPPPGGRIDPVDLAHPDADGRRRRGRAGSRWTSPPDGPPRERQVGEGHLVGRLAGDQPPGQGRRRRVVAVGVDRSRCCMQQPAPDRPGLDTAARRGAAHSRRRTFFFRRSTSSASASKPGATTTSVNTVGDLAPPSPRSPGGWWR